MSIFERITQLLKANVNDLIDRAEEPEKIAKQVIYDLEETVKEVSAGVAAAIAEEKRLLGLKNTASEEVAKWEKRAMAAIEKGDDTLAKEALKRKLEADRELKLYEQSHENQLDQVRSLKEGLRALDEKVKEAIRRRDALIARKRSAEAQKTLSETLGKAGSLGHMDALNKMEEKVNHMERTAEAYETLNEERRAQDLDSHFENLDKDEALEEAFSALKAKMKQPSEGEPAKMG